jgi:zinc transporter
VTESPQKFAFALLLDGKGGARELSETEVASWTPADGLPWVDCDLTDKHAKKWLTRESGVDKSMLAILLAGETRPRSIAEDKRLAIVVRGINMNPGAVPDDMVAIRVVMEPSRILTSRRRKVLSVLDVRDSLLTGKGPKTIGGFLTHLTSCLAGRIEAAVENIEILLEKLDADMAGGDLVDLRTDLGIVRRQAAAIRRHLAPQRDALDRLARSASSLLSDKEVFELREEGDHLTRHIEDLDLARENALVTQEELMNRVVQEQNSRMYLLSVVAAIFLPLTFVTGLLGMNVAGLPGTVSPYGFVVATVVMVVLGFGLVAFFKWRKWI